MALDRPGVAATPEARALAVVGGACERLEDSELDLADRELTGDGGSGAGPILREPARDRSVV
jgi:hypothetical protein